MKQTRHGQLGAECRPCDAVVRHGGARWHRGGEAIPCEVARDVEVRHEKALRCHHDRHRGRGVGVNHLGDEEEGCAGHESRGSESERCRSCGPRVVLCVPSVSIDAPEHP